MNNPRRALGRYTRFSACPELTESGYILPFVLGMVLMLSVITSISARYISDTTTLAIAIENTQKADRALFSAQAAAQSILLNAVAVDGGFDLTGTTNPLADFMSDVRQPGSRPEDMFWGLNGQWKIIETPQGPVYVQLTDTLGLLSVNTGTESAIATLLNDLGVSETDSQKMAATLLDYRDTDRVRRFRGGERADYRLRSLAPPTNRPIRHYGELGQILGWEEGLKAIDYQAFMHFTTLQLSGPSINRFFAPDALTSIMDGRTKPLMLSKANQDISEVYTNYQTKPSSKLRMRCVFVLNSRQVRQRLTEIILQPEHPRKPFKSFRVADNTIVIDNEISAVIESVDLDRIVLPSSDMD